MSNKIIISVCSKGYTIQLNGKLDVAEKSRKSEVGSAGLLMLLHRALQGIANKVEPLGNMVIECSNSHMQKWVLDDVASPPKQLAEEAYKVQKVLDRVPVRVVFRHKKVTYAENTLKNYFKVVEHEGSTVADLFGE